MKYRLLFASLCLGAVVSCQVSTKKQQTSENPAETIPSAKLYIPRRVNLGDFDANNIKKSATLELRNIGDDTLYILAVRPDCDCVEVATVDSVVAPGAATSVHASLDMSDYLLGDTVVKQFVITSNSANERHVRVSLVGVLK